VTEPPVRDEGGEQERRIFGPPGTGKTTVLAGSIRSTVEARGTHAIMVASFTKAAAHEIAGRNLPLDRANVGTLHSFAYRAIERPPLFETKVSGWNARHPAMALSTARTNVDDEMAPADFSGATEGDKAMSEVEVLRARLVPVERWPLRAQAFYKHWCDWKVAEGVIDFTDMIQAALDVDEAPGSPVVGVFDETQDFTPLELSLVRHWGQRMESLVLAGDDDQVLYHFKGATPDAFLDPPLPEDRVRVLSQSYRVPHAVHAVAERWIKQVSRRQPKEYLPRDAEGKVRQAEVRYDRPDPIIPDIEAQLSLGRDVMVLATCAYMLDPLKKALKAAGLPFHNPYRASRTDWNPLKSTGKNTTSAQRVLSYLILDERIFGDAAHGWTGEEVRRWSAMLKKDGVFQRGFARSVAALPDRELTYAEVASLFVDDLVAAEAAEPSLDWFTAHLLPSIRDRAMFPIQVAEKRGAQALLEAPQVVIGTVHSVKGAQADTVYLFPDISASGMRELGTIPGKDAIIRQFYVGMTRASEELVVCTPSSNMTVQPEHLTRSK